MTSGLGSEMVAAVVLNWRDPDRTAVCIRALIQDGSVNKVYLVDNESDPTTKWETFFSSQDFNCIEVLPLLENRGFAAGVNEGLKLFLSGEMTYVLVINNDAKIVPGSVKKLIESAQKLGSPSIVGPKLIYPDGSIQSTGSQINWDSAKVNHTCWPAPPDYLTWACVLLSRDTLKQVGLLDESFFMYWEDADYGLRIQQNNGVLEVVEDAHVIHEESATKGQIGELTVRLATASLGTFATKYPRILTGAKRRVVMRAIRQFLRHGPIEAIKTIRAMAWGLSHKGLAWKEIKGSSWFQRK